MSLHVATIMLVLLAACGKEQEAPHDPPGPTPTQPASAALGDAGSGCPYKLYVPYLAALENGSMLIWPQAPGEPDAKQQLLAADGTLTFGTQAYPRRDLDWYTRDDGGSICKNPGYYSEDDCVVYKLDEELTKLKGHAASALDTKGRYFMLSYYADGGFVVSFTGTGKRIATAKFAPGCVDERPTIIVGRIGVLLCQREGDGSDFYSALIVRDLDTGKLLATIKGLFDDTTSSVIDDARFATYRVDTKAVEAYDLRAPAAPKVTWTRPIPLVKPSILTAAGGVVAVEESAPWRTVMFDATSGAVRKELAIDPCRK